MKMERYKEASLVLNQIMKLDSTYDNAFFGIGVCFDKLGKKMDAQRYYRKFLVNRPDSSQASFVKDRMQKKDVYLTVYTDMKKLIHSH